MQEDTVVRFHQLLQDFGKEALEDLEEKERLWKEARRLEARARQAAAANYQNLLPVHTAAFYGPQQRSESKAQRLERLQQRMRRCRSMPKMTQEEVRPDMRRQSLKASVTYVVTGTKLDRPTKYDWW